MWWVGDCDFYCFVVSRTELFIKGKKLGDVNGIA